MVVVVVGHFQKLERKTAQVFLVFGIGENSGLGAAGLSVHSLSWGSEKKTQLK